MNNETVASKIPSRDTSIIRLKSTGPKPDITAFGAPTPQFYARLY